MARLHAKGARVLFDFWQAKKRKCGAKTKKTGERKSENDVSSRIINFFFVSVLSQTHQFLTLRGVLMVTILSEYKKKNQCDADELRAFWIRYNMESMWRISNYLKSILNKPRRIRILFLSRSLSLSLNLSFIFLVQYLCWSVQSKIVAQMKFYVKFSGCLAKWLLARAQKPKWIKPLIAIASCAKITFAWPPYMIAMYP